MHANCLRLLVACLLLAPAWAQQNLESAYRCTGSAVTAAFETQRAVLQTSSALIQDGHDEVGYGVVVSPQGHILIKASEYIGLKQPTVTVDKTKYPEVEMLAIDPIWDVALIKIKAEGLVPVVYAPTSDVPEGTWVVANGASTRTNRRLLCGIISARIREIPVSGGAALGVVLKDKSKTLEIEVVNKKSGAHEAGLQKGDIILKVDGKPVKKIEELGEILKDRKVGSTVEVTYRRGKKEQTVTVRLAAKSELFANPMNRQDQMSGDYSRRRSGFPRVVQHSILGSSKITGGPVLDLDGRCLGMNIARANRAESFAIPVEDLKALASRLMDQAAKKEKE